MRGYLLPCNTILLKLLSNMEEDTNKSLGSRVELFVKPSLRGNEYLRCLQNLFLLLRLREISEFMDSLNRAQKQILVILEEWWLGKCQDKYLIRPTKLVLCAYALQDGDSLETMELEKTIPEADIHTYY